MKLWKDVGHAADGKPIYKLLHQESDVLTFLNRSLSIEIILWRFGEFFDLSGEKWRKRIIKIIPPGVLLLIFNNYKQRQNNFFDIQICLFNISFVFVYI